MKDRKREIAWSVKTVVKYCSGASLLGHLCLAVGILCSCIILGKILQGEPDAKKAATVFIFPIAGLAAVLYDKKRSRKKLHLLAHGMATRGAYDSKKREVSSSHSDGVSQAFVYRYKFAVEGEESHYATVRRWGEKAHPNEAVVVYDPNCMDENTVLDLEPGGFGIEGERVEGSNLLGAVALLLPLSVVAALGTGVAILTSG